MYDNLESNFNVKIINSKRSILRNFSKKDNIYSYESIIDGIVQEQGNLFLNSMGHIDSFIHLNKDFSINNFGSIKYNSNSQIIEKKITYPLLYERTTINHWEDGNIAYSVRNYIDLEPSKLDFRDSFAYEYTEYENTFSYEDTEYNNLIVTLDPNTKLLGTKSKNLIKKIEYYVLTSDHRNTIEYKYKFSDDGLLIQKEELYYSYPDKILTNKYIYEYYYEKK